LRADAAASTASRPAFVTIASRPSVRRDGKGYTMDLISEKQKYFFERGWTNQKHKPSLICPSGSFAVKALLTQVAIS
jgi:hypothetical protein